MDNEVKQYELEVSWSTRITDEIVLEAIQGNIPVAMELHILKAITELNRGTVPHKELFIKFFSLILTDQTPKPIQAIATQLGLLAGIQDSAEAFEWGILLVKDCKEAGLYTLKQYDSEWYVYPNYTLNKQTKQKLARLQYLPPMKTLPLPWTNNHDGGWFWESKHLILGNRFTKHDHRLAYDVINTLQAIPWEIDTPTYLLEKQTNRVMNKKKFLRVIHEYLGIPFHFVWRYDSRGRSYSSGYDLNLQSNEYGKSLLSLHQKELVNKDAISNLSIAIANHAGQNHLSWTERVKWVATQNLNTITWKEPILGRKAIRALKDTVAGKPTGYVMSVDATSSGLQIMAIISGCPTTGLLVNLIEPTTRYDIYAEIAKLMNTQLKTPVPRKIVKQAAMTHYYNSKATPKALLSEKELGVFYGVIQGLLPGAESVMEAINACWNPQATAHTWVMPDGHTVSIPVVEGVNGRYADPEFGEIPLRWYRQTTSENFRSLCPNVIHSIDGYVAREMVRRCQFQLSHIHDCFVFHPNYLSAVTQHYRQIMAEIADSHLFSEILQQLTGDSSLVFSKAVTTLSQDILKSRYMLS